MKSKILSLFLLTAILGIAMISAATFTVSGPADLAKSLTNTSFTISNPTNATITVNVPQFANMNDGDGHTIYLRQDVVGPVAISASSSVKVTLDYSLDNTPGFDTTDANLLKKLALGIFSQSIKLVNANNVNDTADVNLEFISTSCERGSKTQETTDGDTRELEIISVKDKTSDNDWEWKPLDKVQIDVKVKFSSDDSSDDTDSIIELGLYDTENKEFIEFDNSDDLQRDISLDEGDSTTETFNIVVPTDITDSSSQYRLYVKVYEDGEEENICADTIGSDYYQEISISKESYSVALDQLDITTPVPCGQEVDITSIAYNLGSHDEEDVIVHLVNTELGINLVSQKMDLNEGDSEKVTFNFAVPENTAEKSYKLRLWTEFKFSKSSDTYRDKSEDYFIDLKVEGNCKVVPQISASVTADFDPETPQAIAGQPLIIKATVKNTGKAVGAYTVSTSGNSEWSSLDSIDPKTFILNPGESKDVSISLNVDREAQGDKEFTIKADFEGGSAEQKVALSIEKTTTVDSNAIMDHLRNNWFIYVIALINIVLILAIILVVRSMVSRPSR
jgi:hypothetical protein